ncbi:hypothetical protein COOONC_21964 [Cooperia oncophora]
MVQEKSEYDPCKTSKDICLNKGKCTNRDGDTAAKQTFMDPIELRAFKERTLHISGELDQKQVSLITIQYQCICPDGFIGEFCHITEEERSCEEDYCSSHGQGHYALEWLRLQNAIPRWCDIRSPCAGYSCMNASNCTLKYHEKENAVEAVCECPKAIELVQAKVTGDHCERIETNEVNSPYVPCTKPGSFSSWYNAMQRRCVYPFSSNLLYETKRFERSIG